IVCKSTDPYDRQVQQPSLGDQLLQVRAVQDDGAQVKLIGTASRLSLRLAFGDGEVSNYVYGPFLFPIKMSGRLVGLHYLAQFSDERPEFRFSGPDRAGADRNRLVPVGMLVVRGERRQQIPLDNLKIFVDYGTELIRFRVVEHIFRDLESA